MLHEINHKSVINQRVGRGVGLVVRLVVLNVWMVFVYVGLSVPVVALVDSTGATVSVALLLSSAITDLWNMDFMEHRWLDYLITHTYIYVHFSSIAAVWIHQAIGIHTYQKLAVHQVQPSVSHYWMHTVQDARVRLETSLVIHRFGLVPLLLLLPVLR